VLSAAISGTNKRHYLNFPGPDLVGLKNNTVAMAPTMGTIHERQTAYPLYRRDHATFGNWRDVHITEAYILEGWGEGFMFGALFIMVIITVANMRRGILLHKVILLEVSAIGERASHEADRRDSCCLQ
jgi:hypothetical protein